MIYDSKGIQVRTLHQAVDFKHKTILEIGCGDGRISRRLAKGADRYTAIDPDEDKIREAVAGPGKNKRLHFKTGTGQDLAFDAGSQDLVLFTLSLHHQESVRALEEAFRVLKPGGKALVLEPRVEGELQQLFHLFNDETAALEQAREAVRLSRFSCAAAEPFCVQAEFDGIQDLYAYFFTLELEAPDTPENRARLLTLLGKFGKTPVSGPFIVEEKLILYILEKPLHRTSGRLP